MYLHFQLYDCILDYGPIYSFWCFAFERYNGMLGSYPTNSQQTTNYEEVYPATTNTLYTNAT